MFFIFLLLNMPRKQTGELTPTQLKHRNAKERDAKFREFIQRSDVIEEAALLKKSKRIGHMKERFEAETGYRIPLSMVYKNFNKVHPKPEQPSIDTITTATPVDEPPIKFDSSDDNHQQHMVDSDAIEVPISSDDSDGDIAIV